MGFTLVPDLDMDFASDIKAGKDPKKDLFTYLASQGFNSSFQLYFGISNFLLTNVGKYEFIDADLADIAFVAGGGGVELNKSLNFTATDAAKMKWFLSRKDLLAKIFAYVQAAENKPLLSLLYGTANVDALLAAIANSVIQPKDPATMVSYANTLRSFYDFKMPFSAMFATRDDSLKVELPAFMNNPNITPYCRKGLISCLIDRMIARAKNASSDKARINKLREKIGLPQKMESYSVTYMENLTEVKEKLFALACPAAGLGTIPADLFTAAGHFFLSNVNDVIIPAVNDFKNGLLDTTGCKPLDAFSEADFNNSLFQNTRDGVAVLYDLVFKIMDNITIKCEYNKGTGAKNTYPMYMYPFFNKDSYQANVTGAITIILKGFFCQNNTLDIPLASPNGSSIEFYNTQSKMYLYGVDTTIYPFDTPAYPALFGPNNDMPYTKLETTDPIEKEKIKKWMNSLFIANAQMGHGGTGMIVNFQRTYQPFYVADDTDKSLVTHLINPLESGAGGSIGRCEPADTNNYLWHFAGNLANLNTEAKRVLNRPSFNFTAGQLAAYLELETKANMAAPLNSVGRKAPAVVPSNSIKCIPVPVSAQVSCRYYLCNMPYVPAAGRVGNVANQDRLLNFQFYYYRKAILPAGEPADSSYYKIVKSQGGGAINVNLPVPLQVPGLYASFVTFKQKNNAVKNKGSFLYNNKKMRASAGNVMLSINPYYRYKVATPNNALSATTFFNNVMLNSDAAVNSWREIKTVKATDKPQHIEQEWCHLLGHGDGGDERVGNFVSGSKDCNSEQLAIETGQRSTTQQSGSKNLYMLKSSAYLLADTSMNIKDGKTYLGNTLESVIKKAYANLDLKDKPKIEAEIRKTVQNAPVAGFIRYKIFFRKDVNSPFQKVFDYVFEGQSEFMDINQFNIISRTMQYLLNPTAFYKGFYQFIYPEATL